MKEKLTSQRYKRTRIGMRYTKYGIFFGMAVVTLGLAMTFIYGYRPQPERIMKPSFFDRPEEIGAILLKRFYAPLESESVVVLGVVTTNEWSQGVVKGFLDTAKSNNREFKRVIVEAKLNESLKAMLKQLVPNTIEADTNSQTMAAVIDALEAAKTAQEKTLVVVPNVYSTHLLSGNSLDRLEKLLNQEYPLFAVTLANLALEAAEEKVLDPICIGSERDGSGTADLGCSIASAGRYYYRKRVLEKEPGVRQRYTAIMTSTKEKDYLMLVREPDRK